MTDWIDRKNNIMTQNNVQVQRTTNYSAASILNTAIMTASN